MSAGNVIPIKVVLDKSGAVAEAGQFRTNLQQISRQIAADARSAHQADAAAAVQASKIKIDAAGRARDETGKFVKTVGEAGTALGAMGDSGARGFASVMGGLDVTRVGMGKLIEMAGAFGRAMDAAAAKSRELARGFVDKRDSLGELATLMGRPNDNDFTLDMATFTAKTRMRGPESQAFLTELYNSGAQYKGNRISGKEFDQFAVQSGQLATALGFDKGEAGNMAGTVLGFRDFSKFGDDASETALGQMNSDLQVLGHGKGRQPVLMNQYSMLGSAALKEEGVKGAFNDSGEAAIALSIAAEKHDAQAAELTLIANRFFGKFDSKKSGAMLKRAGIDANSTNFLENLEKLAPVVKAMASEQGKSESQILRENSADVTQAEAIEVFLNKGVAAGGFNERRNFARSVQGPARAFDTIRSYMQSDAGVTRLRDAQVEMAQAGAGAKNSRVETLRREAIAQMIQQGELDSTDKLFNDYLTGALSFGMIPDAKSMRIDETVESNLRRRLPKSERRFRVGLPLTPEAREKMFNEHADIIERSGVNPLTGLRRTAPGAAGAAGAANAADGNPNAKMESLLEAQNALLGAVVRGMSPGVPAPLFKPQPTMRR